MKKSKGFSLAELLIVVAIMAILVGITIPVFSSVLEKTREGVDTANIRSEYAHIMTAVVGGEYDRERDAEAYIVQLVQTQDGWQSDVSDHLPFEIADQVEPKAKGFAVLTYNDNNIAVINLSYSETQETLH